jgi:hypothetical protein
MVKYLRNIFRLPLTRKFAIIICLILISGFIISDVAEYFRGMIGWGWIYKYGSLLSNFLFIGSLIWSLINSMLIVKDGQPNWKINAIWTFISLIPILYIVFSLVAWHFEF